MSDEPTTYLGLIALCLSAFIWALKQLVQHVKDSLTDVLTKVDARHADLTAKVEQHTEERLHLTAALESVCETVEMLAEHIKQDE